MNSSRNDFATRLSLNTLLLASTLWLLNHPYGGIRHDAWLYAASALHWLDPSAYRHDPFFMFGSQDDYSLFSPFFGTLIRTVGLPNASMGITVLGALLWLAAIRTLAMALLSGGHARTFATLAGAVYAFNYSLNANTFLTNENFATARILAMPLGLMALSCAVSGHRAVMGWALAAFSFLLHPLIGVWPLLLMVAWRNQDRTLLIFMAAAGFCVLGFGSVAAVHMFRPMSPEWIRLVDMSGVDVVAGRLGKFRLSDHLFWIAALWVAGRWATPAFRRCYLVMACLAAWALLAAVLVSYFYPIEILVEGQPWRAMWLASTLGLFGLIDVAAGFARDRVRFMVLFIGCALLFAIKDSAACVLLGLPILLRGHLGQIVAEALAVAYRRTRWLVGACIAITLVVLPSYGQELLLLGYGWRADQGSLPATLWGFWVTGGSGLGVLAAAVLLPTCSRSKLSWLVFGIALLGAATFWDQRSGTAARWEKAAAPELAGRELLKYVKRGETVFWPGNMWRVWYELRTAGYASGEQASGMVFSESKSRELVRRISRLAIASKADHWPLNSSAQAKLLMDYRRSTIGNPLEVGNLHLYSVEHLTDAGVAYVCEDPALDWVVSADEPRTVIVAAVRLPDSQSGFLFAYDCRRFRASTAQRSGSEPPAISR